MSQKTGQIYTAKPKENEYVFTNGDNLDLSATPKYAI